MIFRDLINFSKDAINLILKPAWKLLNSHLPVFTEVVAFNQLLESPKTDEPEGEEQVEETQSRGAYLEKEAKGVEGMTFHLIELLSTLVLRLNVQSLVYQGLIPLITSVSSYLLVQHNQERQHRGDATFFISEDSQEMHRVQSIRNQSLTLISSLIEVFGDDAVQAVLLVVHNILFHSEDQAENPWLNKSASS